VGRDGTIVWADVSADYRERPTPDQLLRAAK
jgi:hypothetical protein